MRTPKIKIIAGPTASGKSALALSLAQKTGGVIINADSQQVYRDLPILTARPTPEEESLVPHKLYGFVAVDEIFSAGKWLRMAKMEIDWVLSNGQLPIVVGGTGMYLGALINGIAEIPEIDDAVRAQATSDFEQMGKEAFSSRLREIDPGFFERLKVHDKQRLLRAYAVWLGTGKTLSYWQALGNKAAYSKNSFDIEIVMPERDEIYKRCDERFVKMVEKGAVEEVMSTFFLWEKGGASQDEGSHTPIRSPHPRPLPKGEGIKKIIGFREISAYLRGEMEINQAIEKAQQMTRNYAKRQMTWFRNQLS